MAVEPHGIPEERRKISFAEEAHPAYYAHDEVSVRWGPVFAGVLVAMGINIVMYALSVAIALSTASPEGTPLAQDILQSVALWSAIGWLVSLFVGGYLAGRLGTYYGLRRGVLQGTVVWSIYLLAWLVIASGGIAGALGAINNPEAMANRPGAIPNPSDILNTASATTWWFLAAMVIGWLAAAIGGMLGVKSLEKKVSEAR